MLGDRSSVSAILSVSVVELGPFSEGKPSVPSSGSTGAGGGSAVAFHPFLQDAKAARRPKTPTQICTIVSPLYKRRDNAPNVESENALVRDMEHNLNSKGR